jgi:NAD(P)-dependent dehydrogenase (short-subunit alcohol dehydrogenase family)
MVSTQLNIDFPASVGVVIGAGGHLMSSVAEAMGLAGITVVCGDKSRQAANETASRINELGGTAHGWECDVTSSSSIEKLREFSLSLGPPLRFLVNGAGINAPTPFMEVEREEWRSILEVNLVGVFDACKIFAEHFLAEQWGSIVNVSSASADPPLSKALCYSAAKAGVVNLTKNLAREWAANGIRVNAVRPGFFPTEWNLRNFIDDDRKRKILNHTPMGRFGQPHEIQSAVLWLLSDSSSFVTGSEIAIDGGFSCMTI